MLEIALKELFDLLKAKLKSDWKNRNNADRWDANVEGIDTADGRVKATMKEASLEAAGFRFVVEYEVPAGEGEKKARKETITLEARPGGKAMKIFVKDEGDAEARHDADARIVYKATPSFGNPGRFHLDFKRVDVGDDERRYNFAYPKG